VITNRLTLPPQEGVAKTKDKRVRTFNETGNRFCPARLGVIDPGFLSVMRRWVLGDKMPIRKIARHTSLSRTTIKKYLREDAVEPQFKTPSRAVKRVSLNLQQSAR